MIAHPKIVKFKKNKGLANIYKVLATPNVRKLLLSSTR